MVNLLSCKCGSTNIQSERTGNEAKGIIFYHIGCKDCDRGIDVEVFDFEKENYSQILTTAWNEAMVALAAEPTEVKKVTALPECESFVGMTEYQGQLIVCSNKSIYELTENGLKILELEFDNEI
jgi:hypothetical protein